MKKMVFVIAAIAVAVLMCADKAYAPLVLQTDQDSSSSSSSDSSSNQDTSVVDLSDKDTDQATWSPSFENETPSGSAPGGPVEE